MTPDDKQLLRLLCLLTTFLFLQGRVHASAQDFDAGVDSLVGPLVEERLIPGFYLGIYDKNGLVFEKSKGFADEKIDLQPSSQVLYHINSMIKP